MKSVVTSRILMILLKLCLKKNRRSLSFPWNNCFILLIPRSAKYQPKFGKNLPDIKMLNLSLETIKANYCHHDASHQN